MVHDRASCRQSSCWISLRRALLAHKDDDDAAG